MHIPFRVQLTLTQYFPSKEPTMYGDYIGGVAITPSDTVGYNPASAIWVGGAGVVALVSESGAVTNYTCVAGTILPVRSKRVNSANTTATLLVALYK